MYPSVAALASLAILSTQLVCRSTPVQRVFAKFTKSDVLPQSSEDVESSGASSQVTSHVAELGGPVCFAFLVTRLLSCLSLLGLYIAGLVLSDEEGSEHNRESHWVAIGLSGTFVRIFPSLSLLWQLRGLFLGIRITPGLRFRHCSPKPE